MKNDDKCLKCDSDGLVRIPPTPGEEPHIVVGDRVLHTVLVTKFVCTNCGYIEQWVESTSDLGLLKEKYRQ